MTATRAPVMYGLVNHRPLLAAVFSERIKSGSRDYLCRLWRVREAAWSELQWWPAASIVKPEAAAVLARECPTPRL